MTALMARDQYKVDASKVTGGHLLYDCESGHFACLSLVNKKKCEQVQGSRIKENAVNKGCLFIRSYKEFSDCYKEQFLLTARDVRHSLCINENANQ